MEIVYRSKQLVVIYKPPFIPSQKDPSEDADAMSLTSEALREMGENDTLWLVHRLDRTVGGLMVFARTKKAAATLSSLVADDGIGKEYLAVCDGRCCAGEMVDYLFKDSAKGKSFVVDRMRTGVKEAKLFYYPVKTVEKDDSHKKTLARIKLVTGRFHQIRAQLSSRGAPITGDGKYGSRDNGAKAMALFAYRLRFVLFGERVDVVRLPDISAYPWSLFDKSEYDSLKMKGEIK